MELCDQTNIGGHFDQLLDLNMGFLMEYCWGIEENLKQLNIGGHFDQLLDLNMGFLMEYCWGIE